MLHDPKSLASVLSLEMGLNFKASSRRDSEGYQVISLVPEDHNPAHTFSIEITIQWRRLQLSFVPGKFAGSLLQVMSEADVSGRSVFQAVCKDCERLGAKLVVAPNGMEYRFDSNDLWNNVWRRFSFQLSKGNIELGTEDGIPDFEILRKWATRFAAAVVSLLPLEEYDEEELKGFPEGAVQRVEINRYERDRRNLAAALAIHGSACLACGMDFGRTYGPAAAGYIEVHHVVSVSRLGTDYVVDPKKDLVPLCPNCHAVAHRRNPPFTVAEIKEFLASTH